MGEGGGGGCSPLPAPPDSTDLPLDNIKSVLPNILGVSDSFINEILLFGDTSLDILNVAISYITSIKRFDDSVFTFKRNKKNPF